MVHTPLPKEIYFTNPVSANEIAQQILERRSTLPLLKEGPLLEAGCGTGNILEAIARISPDIDLIGVDCNSEYLHEAKKSLNGQVGLAASNIRRMPFESGTVPVVLTKNVYRPFNTGELCRAMVEEIVRIMPVGGHYFCYDGFYGEHRSYLKELGCEIVNKHDPLVVKR